MVLQQIFIANLKKFRKIRGISQMTLTELCDMGGNYIGQIEMGRRIPSFEKIEKIAAALEIDSHELFMQDEGKKAAVAEPKTKDFLKKMPSKIKKEIISKLLSAINKDAAASLNAENYYI